MEFFSTGEQYVHHILGGLRFHRWSVGDACQRSVHGHEKVVSWHLSKIRFFRFRFHEHLGEDEACIPELCSQRNVFGHGFINMEKMPSFKCSHFRQIVKYF